MRVISAGKIRLTPGGDLVITGWAFEAPEGIDLLAMEQLAIDHECAAILEGGLGMELTEGAVGGAFTLLLLFTIAMSMRHDYRRWRRRKVNA